MPHNVPYTPMPLCPYAPMNPMNPMNPNPMSPGEFAMSLQRWDFQDDLDTLNRECERIQEVLAKQRDESARPQPAPNNSSITELESRLAFLEGTALSDADNEKAAQKTTSSRSSLSPAVMGDDHRCLVEENTTLRVASVQQKRLIEVAICHRHIISAS